MHGFVGSCSVTVKLYSRTNVCSQSRQAPVLPDEAIALGRYYPIQEKAQADPAAGARRKRTPLQCTNKTVLATKASTGQSATSPRTSAGSFEMPHLRRADDRIKFAVVEWTYDPELRQTKALGLPLGSEYEGSRELQEIQLAGEGPEVVVRFAPSEFGS